MPTKCSHPRVSRGRSIVSDSVVLAAEKKVTGKLLNLSVTKEGGYRGSGKKIFLLTKYVCPCCYLGVHALDGWGWLTWLLRTFSSVVSSRSSRFNCKRELTD